MTESKLSPVVWLLISWAAMLSGMGLLLFELVSGVLYRSVPSYVLGGIYLLLLFMSVWGMKTILELQSAELFQLRQIRQQFQRLVSGKSRKAPQSHNLFRLPAEGQIYVLMLTIMLLGALFGKTNTLMLIFALMAGPFIVNGGITFGMTRRLSMSRQLPRRIMLGEPTSVDITVYNRKRLITSNLISVEDRITGPRELLNGRLMFALIPARSSRTGRYQVRFMQRGQYRLGPTRITSRFPLGIVERGQQLEIYDDLLVYPRIGHLAPWWLRRLAEGQEMSRMAQGQSGAHHDEFHRIREYRHGDELRSIHWKTSARKNELMVREYQQNRDRRMLLVLDLWQSESAEDVSPERHLLIEHAVSLATTLGWFYVQESGPQQLDYLCFGTEQWQWLGSTRMDQPQTLLDQLALAEAGSQYTFSQIEAEVLNRQSASTRTVLITTRTHKERQNSSTVVHEKAGTLHGLTIIEADPAKTAEFFQLDPIPA